MKLLVLEYRKLRGYRPFWVLLILHFLLMAIVLGSLTAFFNNLQLSGMGFQLGNDVFYKFPDVWQNLTYAAKWFALFFAILVISSITNEYTYRTNRQNIIDGLSRQQFVTSKLLLVLALGLLGTLFVWVAGTILGFVYADAEGYITQINFLGAYFLSVVGLYSLAMFISFLIRRAALSILLLLGWAFVFEPLLYWQILPDSLASWLPLKALGNMIQVPYNRYIPMEVLDSALYVPLPQVIGSLAWTALFIGLSYWIETRRDL